MTPVPRPSRQLLLERSTLRLIPALEQVAGLQAQDAPSVYVALWSRLHGFRREALTEALEPRYGATGRPEHRYRLLDAAAPPRRD